MIGTFSPAVGEARACKPNNTVPDQLVARGGPHSARWKEGSSENLYCHFCGRPLVVIERVKPYSISVRETLGVTVIDLRGDMQCYKDYSIVVQVKDLLAANKKKILLHLANVTEIGKNGIVALTEAYTESRKQGGQLKLVNPTKQIRKRLELLRLTTVFEVYADEDEAMASFE
jgi:anti-sigma B factor antagonist